MTAAEQGQPVAQNIELIEMVVVGIDKDGRFVCSLRGVNAYNALRHVGAALWYLGQQAFGSKVDPMTSMSEPHVHPPEVKPLDA